MAKGSCILSFSISVVVWGGFPALAGEMDRIRKTKPVILGGFGSFRHIDDSFAQAADNLLRIRDLTIEYQLRGIVMWTYDTFEQKRLYPAMEDKGDVERRPGRRSAGLGR